MTASTVHTHHVKTHKIPLADWCGDRTDQFVMWVKSGDEDVSAWSVVWRWLLKHHLYGLVVTAVALTFVSGLVLTLHLSDEDAWSILVALAGYPPIAGAVAYHIGGTS